MQPLMAPEIPTSYDLGRWKRLRGFNQGFKASRPFGPESFRSGQALLSQQTRLSRNFPYLLRGTGHPIWLPYRVVIPSFFFFSLSFSDELAVLTPPPPQAGNRGLPQISKAGARTHVFHSRWILLKRSSENLPQSAGTAASTPSVEVVGTWGQRLATARLSRLFPGI